MAAYVDTSAFYAYVVLGDRFHADVDAWMTTAIRRQERLFSSSFVLCETLGLLQARHGVSTASRFMTDVAPLVEWRWVDDALFHEAWAIVVERAERDLTVVDAMAAACIAERPGATCVAIDGGLSRLGLNVVPVIPLTS